MKYFSLLSDIETSRWEPTILTHLRVSYHYCIILVNTDIVPQFPSSCLKLEDYIKHSNEGVGTLHCKYIEPTVFVNSNQ
jgi:hypothetical protein